METPWIWDSNPEAEQSIVKTNAFKIKEKSDNRF
jgi:hypothetical protein